MLKTTKWPNVLKLEVKNGNNKIVRFGISSGSKKLAKKLGKLFNFEKLSKSRKKPSKVGIHLSLALKKLNRNFYSSVLGKPLTTYN